MPILLNARRRHRRGHTFGFEDQRRSADCSTPKGVIVEGTSPGRWIPSPLTSAQRPKASSSRARRPRTAWPTSIRSAQRPKASSSRALPRLKRSRTIMSCSTPEGVIVEGTPSCGCSGGIPCPLLNARRRHRRGHGGSVGGTVRHGLLLNARRRHRRGHGVLVSPVFGPQDLCSTPEGVIVEGTARRRLSTCRMTSAQRPKASSSRARRGRGSLDGATSLLNARRRHRRGHSKGSGGSDRSRTAQRPKASSSRARLRPPSVPAYRNSCSTPEGVIVEGTPCSPGSPRPTPRTAQRPKASSSRARPRGPSPGPRPCLLNARRRHRRGHAAQPGDRPRELDCSTPEGVIVEGTVASRPRSTARSPAQRPKASSSRAPVPRSASTPRRLTAQRPKASSSRAPRTAARPGRGPVLLNARRRHRRGHPFSLHGGKPYYQTAQRPKASSSRARGPRRSCLRRASAAQRPKASSSRAHVRHLGRRPGQHGCSTPEGVIVEGTPRPRSGRSAATSAQRPKASSSRARPRGGRPASGR